jgi:hypothetical protein
MSIVGDVAELKFMVLMREMGYTVCKPMSHHSRYDFIVDMDGDMKRVQVKSTSYRVKSTKDNAYLFHSYTQRKKRRYLKSEIDFIAVYVPDFDAWYMIPMDDIFSESLKVYPHNPNSKGKYEKYRIQ